MLAASLSSEVVDQPIGTASQGAAALSGVQSLPARQQRP